MPHLLLVDDDQVCLRALSDCLQFAFRGQNLEVDVADSAATGLRLTTSLTTMPLLSMSFCSQASMGSHLSNKYGTPTRMCPLL